MGLIPQLKLTPDPGVDSTKDRKIIEDQIAIKDTKKLILAAVLAAAVAALVAQIAQKPASTLTLTAAENRFRVEFKIPKNQRDLTAQVLEKLTIPQDILGGFEFELDSTSSARLAFASPVETQIKFKDSTVTFKGKMAKGFTWQIPAGSKFKIPKNTQAGAFTRNFQKAAAYYLGNQELAAWYGESFSESPQYLIIFEKDQFAIAAPKSESADFTVLETIKIEGQDDIYKQENFDLGENSVNLSIIKIGSPSAEQEKPTFFQLGDFLYLASSPQAAKDLINSQLGNAPSVFFPQPSGAVSFYAFLTGGQDAQLTSLQPIINDKEIIKYLSNIHQFELVIRGENFSGEIELVQ